MGPVTVNAGLDPVFHQIIPSAVLTGRIQRTVAENAVKLILINSFMAGKVSALPVREEFLRIFHPEYQLLTSFSEYALCR